MDETDTTQPAAEPTARQKAAAELLKRRRCRRSFRDWCISVGHQPALHHDLIIQKLQEVTDSATSRFVILLCPPGAAKSTYTSMDFPSWYLGRKTDTSEGGCPSAIKGPGILACSYNTTKAEHFGRVARNYVDQYSNVLGFTLRKDSKSVGEWETSNGGRYFCAGVGTGIAGYRFDLGLIDDYLGSQEDADSKPIRDKQWDWFMSDFYPRMRPNGSIVIIANRRHEEDLVGRLISPDPEKRYSSPIDHKRWEVIKLPFFAKENDVLKREVGERLWPEWFTEDQAEAVRKLPPRIRAGLYDQEPRPEEGDFFKTANLIGYSRDQLPAELMLYGAGDFAVSVEEGANKTCLLPGGVCKDGILWLLPDIWWKRAGSGDIVTNLINLFERRQLQMFVAEKGHISKSIGPFLRQQMMDRRIFCSIEEVTPSKGKDVRARSAQGMTELGLVRFPKFATWWEDAENELITFPGGSSDDFVDAFAHLCNYVNKMLKSPQPKKELTPHDPGWRPTLQWLKSSATVTSTDRYEGR